MQRLSVLHFLHIGWCFIYTKNVHLQKNLTSKNLQTTFRG